jgi:hypothetical protein
LNKINVIAADDYFIKSIIALCKYRDNISHLLFNGKKVVDVYQAGYTLSAIRGHSAKISFYLI